MQGTRVISRIGAILVTGFLLVALPVIAALAAQEARVARLISNLKQRTPHLRLGRFPGYRPEPMPRMRWYS